jgi:predicted nucleic acid-binding protein
MDAAYHLAVLDRRDTLHRVATQQADRLARETGVTFVTTHLVVAELLASLSRLGADSRQRAARYARELSDETDVVFVESTNVLFQRALDLYAHRLDKRYSLTDCMSMVVCREMEITQVLTSDRDFEQEGFEILLRASRSGG